MGESSVATSSPGLADAGAGVIKQVEMRVAGRASIAAGHFTRPLDRPYQFAVEVGTDPSRLEPGRTFMPPSATRWPRSPR